MSAHRSAEQEMLRRLLPDVYWETDLNAGGALAALVDDVLADEYRRLRDAVAALYDDVFLQTCEERIVPYFGEGLGVTGLPPARGPGVSNRGWVGSIVALRRRKGTLAAAARGAAAATGWAIYAQEGLVAASRTQAVDHAKPAEGALVDLGDSAQTTDLAEPWSRAARVVDVHGRPFRAGLPVRSDPAAAAGCPAPSAVAVSVWRLRAFPVRGRNPRPAAEHSAPEGRAFTFDPLGLERPLFHTPALDDPHGPPTPAEVPRPLTIPALTALLRDRGGHVPLAVHRDGADGKPERIRRHDLEAHDLRHWRVARETPAEVLVDPERGRLLFTRERPTGLTVDYAYGFAGSLGGGPYVAADEPAAFEPITRLGDDEPLAAALADGRQTVIVPDSRTHRAPHGGWHVPLEDGQALRVAAAPGQAPVLDGDLHVTLDGRARLELVGLTISGSLHVRGAGTLTVEHSTLVPRDRSSLTARGNVAVSLGFCVTGPIEAGRGVHLSITDSIVDGQGAEAVGGAEPTDALDAQRMTALGGVTARVVVAEDCIFAGPLRAPTGLVRNSAIAEGSEAPQLLACERSARPRFTSVRYGAPGYAQLHLLCPAAIASGGLLGREMGAFNWLDQPARVALLPVVLHDLLPAGVAASVSYIT